MPQDVSVQICEVTRSYRHSGKNLGVGSVVSHKKATAQELRTAGKVHYVDPGTALKLVPPVRAPRRVVVGHTSEFAPPAVDTSAITAKAEAEAKDIVDAANESAAKIVADATAKAAEAAKKNEDAETKSSTGAKSDKGK